MQIGVDFDESRPALSTISKSLALRRRPAAILLPVYQRAHVLVLPQLEESSAASISGYQSDHLYVEFCRRFNRSFAALGLKSTTVVAKSR